MAATSQRHIAHVRASRAFVCCAVCACVWRRSVPPPKQQHDANASVSLAKRCSDGAKACATRSGGGRTPRDYPPEFVCVCV